MSGSEWNSLLELREALGLTQANISETLKISRAAISKIERGVNRLSDRNIEFLCKRYNVRREWLERGEGPMREMSPADAFEALRAQFDLRPKDMILIESLLSLSERERDGLIAWMESFAATARAVSGGEAPRASPAPAGPERTVEDEADDIAEEARRAFLEERGIRRGSGAYGPGKSGTA